MASNIFSRLVPPSRTNRSFYEQLRDRDEEGFSDEHVGTNIDEQNLKEQFHDYDVEAADGLDPEGSRISIDSAVHPESARHQHRPHHLRPRELDQRWHLQEDDLDNDVPASLLVEPHEADQLPRAGAQRARRGLQSRPPAVAGPSSRRSRAQWDAVQSHQKLHRDDTFGSSSGKSHPAPLVTGVVARSARERAMWRWVNVLNLDNFVREIYDYYEGNGIRCILSDRLLRLLESTFVAVFLTFLTQCVNYPMIPRSKRLQEIVVPQCTNHMSGIWSLGLWIYVFYFIWKCVQFTVDLRRLLHIRDFYVHLLNIPEQDMQTVSWQDVVARVMALRDANPKTAVNVAPGPRRYIGSQSKERLDAHDIANRLMRKDNYFIAMINKDLLDLTLPIPFLGRRQFLSTNLEWYLYYGIIDFVFDQNGQVNQEFLKADRRGTLSRKLRQRLIFAGVLNIILAPFVVAYFVIVYFFTYYSEYHDDPSKFGARRYTPFARWKFREFNEVPHLFEERLKMSYPFAMRYIDQFPKQVTERAAKTVTFIAGSLAAVLAVASLLDPELFLGFEVTPDRTALFYMGILGAIWAFARKSIPEETLVFDPEYALRNVIDYTHYMPDYWQGRLHSSDVKREFSDLYKLKFVIFLEEIIGVLTTGFILLLALPKCSDHIIDFFREFTIHVDGLGYVCSFAVFDFKKGVGNVAANNDVREDYYSTKHGKMAASYYGFLDNYVINPKTGIPGHLPPGLRQQFHPPPAFPGLNSPTLAADMQGSRMGRPDRPRPRSRGPTSHLQAARTPRFGPSAPQPSPMASMLLDPHHQPSSSGFGGRSVHRARQARGGYPGGGNIIEESVEDGLEGGATSGKLQDEEDVFEGNLGESVWETSPTKALSRENSGTQGREPDGGVLGLIYQFQQAHKNHRAGGVL